MFTEALIVLGENDTDDDILNRGDIAITGDVPDVALSEEAWDYRLKQLGTVERRSNFDGYELPENIQERRACMLARSKFLRDLQRELIRREKAPTERDHVESTLVVIIDKVLKRERISRRKDEGSVRDPSWHIATKGHVMSRLQGPDSDLSGQDKSSSVTDLPFVDLIITHSAMMLRVMPSTSSSVIATISDHDPELTQQEDTRLIAIADVSLSQPLMRPFILQGVSDLLRRVGYKIKKPPSEIPVNSPIIEKKSTEDSCVLPLRNHEAQKAVSEDTVTITVIALLDPPPLFIKREAQSTLSLPIGISYISNALSPFPPHATRNQVSTAVYTDRNDRRHQNISCFHPPHEQNKSLVGTGGNAGYYSTHCRSLIAPPRTRQVKNADTEGRGGGEKEKNRLVYDKSARLSFEAQFIAEIALACSLPVENMNIEEIRHLDPKDSRLVALVEEQRVMLSRQQQEELGRGASGLNKANNIHQSIGLSSVTNKVKTLVAHRIRESLIPTEALFDIIPETGEGDIYDDNISIGSDDDRYDDDSVVGDDISEDDLSVQSALTPNDYHPPQDYHEGVHEGEGEGECQNGGRDGGRDGSLQLSLMVPDSYGVTNHQTYAPMLNGSQVRGVSAIAHSNTSNERNAQKTKQQKRLDKIERRARQIADIAEESKAACETWSGVSSLLTSAMDDIKYQAQEISMEITENLQIASNWAGVSGMSPPCIPAISQIGCSGIKGKSSTPVTGCIQPLINSMKRKKKKCSSSASHSTTCADVVGCEISFTVTVKAEQRERLGIFDWEAADVPLLLARQMMEEKSPLKDGEYTKHILDIRFKKSHSRRTFLKWESYWSHILHPVFFGRSAIGKEKTHRNSTELVKFDGSKIRNVIKKKSSENYLLELVRGMNYKMPCDEFSLRSIRAFLTLPSVSAPTSTDGKGEGDKWALVGLYPPKPRKKLLIDDYQTLLSSGTADQSTANIAGVLMVGTAHEREEVQVREEEDGEGDKYDMDDSNNEDEELIRVGLKEAPKEFKFNASNVTQHTVDQLELQVIAADEALFVAMKKGLVDGVRLRPEQVAAMRERDAVKRIYLMAKQTYNRQSRQSGIAAVDPEKEVLVITEVRTESYNRWVREVRREEHRALLLRQRAITDMKSLRRNEAALQSTYATLRHWLVNELARGYVVDHPEVVATEVVVQLNREVVRIKSSTVSGISGSRSSSTEMALERQRAMVIHNMEILSETKRTKQLFRIVLQWVRRVKRLCREGPTQHRNHHHHRRRAAGRSPVNSKTDCDSHSCGAASVGSRDSRTANSDNETARSYNRQAGNISNSKSRENGNRSRHGGRSHYSGAAIMRAMATRGKNTAAGCATDLFLQQTCSYIHSYDRCRAGGGGGGGGRGGGGRKSHDAQLSEGFSFNRQLSDMLSINSSVTDVHSRGRENNRCESGIIIARSHQNVDPGSDQESEEDLTGTGVEYEDDVNVLECVSKTYLLAFVETVRVTQMHRRYQQEMTDRRAAAALLIVEAEQERVRSEVEGHVTEIRSKREIDRERRINSSTSTESHSTQKSSRLIRAGKTHSNSNLTPPRQKDLQSNDPNIVDPDSPPGFPPELVLLEEEVTLAEQVCWLPQMLASDCLMKTFQEMHTSDEDGTADASISAGQLRSEATRDGDVISMHQLVQYAVIMKELGPAWRNLLASMEIARKIGKEKAVAARQEEEEYNEYERALRDAEQAVQGAAAINDHIDTNGQGEGEGGRLHRRVGEEKRAVGIAPHTHMYVMPPRCNSPSQNGQQLSARPREPFCTVCSRYKHLARISGIKTAEATHHKFLGNSITRKLSDYDRSVKSALKFGMLEERMPLPPRLSTYVLDISMAHLGIAKMHPALLMSGLSVFSPYLVDAIPVTALGASKARVVSTPSTTPSLSPPFLPLPPTTTTTTMTTAALMDAGHHINDIGSSACSVLIRVWYLDTTGVCGDLIGSVHLNDEAMKSTTRGARTHPLTCTGMMSSSDSVVQEDESRGRGGRNENGEGQRGREGGGREEDKEGPNTGETEDRNRLIVLRSPFRDRNSKERSVTECKATLSLRMYSTKVDRSTGECSRWHLEIIQGRRFPSIGTEHTAAVNSPPNSSIVSRRELGDGSAVDTKTVPSDNAVMQHQGLGDQRRKVEVEGTGRDLGSLCTAVCEVLWKGSVGNTATSHTSSSRPVSMGRSAISNAREGQQSDGANSVDTTADALDGTEGVHKKPAFNVLPTVLSTWVHIGCTSSVDIGDGTGDYLFTGKVKGSTGSLFDLPPICMPHSERHSPSNINISMTDRGEVSVGKWVPRNHLTRPTPNLTTSKKSCITMRTIAYTVRCWLMLLKKARKRPGGVLLRHRHDMQKLLLEAEECERHFMFREDIRMRSYGMHEEHLKYRDLARDQIVIYQQFNRLMSLITCPTRTLSRLLFFMGSALNSGGIRVTCLDIAENLDSPRSMLEVFIVPVIYPEDEEEMKRHVSAVSSACRTHRGLTPIVELSMHDVSGYTADGFSMEMTRTAMVIMERNENYPTLTEYLSRKHTFTDCELVRTLITVLQGLVGLHSQGVVHRNLHEGAVFVPPVPPLSSTVRTINGVTHLNNPVCRIGEFWFLENPRAVGCEYSKGRADWGDRSSAPPEARGGYQVSTASDVYAFGLCVLKWIKCLDRRTSPDVCVTQDAAQLERKRLPKIATKSAVLGALTSGVLLPPNSPLRNLINLVPSRWDAHSWVYQLLHMCLQEDPTLRGAAKDVLAFMQSIH